MKEILEKINWKQFFVEILRLACATLAGALAGCRFAIFNV